MLDISLNDNIFIDTELDAAIQELDMLFNTENTELIGYPEYGTFWDDFLWQLTPSTLELQRYITEKMSATIFLPRFSPKVEIDYEIGTERAIYYVKITLTNPYTGEVTNIQQYELK